MVGYEDAEKLSSQKKLFAGCFAGFVSRLVSQPLDVLKTRWQLQVSKSQTYSLMAFGENIRKKEGIKAFFRGHLLGQVHAITAVGSQFYFYEMISEISFKNRVNGHSPYTRLTCGCLAGCMSACLVNPLEVVRVRQMLVGTNYRGMVAGFKRVYKSGGIRSFYEGLSASLIQIGPSSGITFAAFGFFQPLFLNMLAKRNPDEEVNRLQHKPHHVLISSTAAGSCSAIFAKTLLYPLDLAKRRLQIGTHIETDERRRELVSCRSLLKCLSYAYNSGGIKGLYRGFSVTVFKAQLTTAVSFGTYEVVCWAIQAANG